jgi:signal transduction histidine kinase
VFRIAQEALNNAQAHAQAQHVRVELGFSECAVALRVSDDGVGFDAREIQERIGAHLGLIGMRDRGASVGGTVEIESQLGKGTRIALCVPCEKSFERAELSRV